MKVSRNITSFNKLLKLKLLKTKIYTKKYTFANIKLEELEHRLKKALQVIHKYHIQNKRILFVFPYFKSQMKVIRKLFGQVKHHFLPGIQWMWKFLTHKKNSYDLIVILSEPRYINLVLNFYSLNKPIIYIRKDLNISFDYHVIGEYLVNCDKKKQTSFFLTSIVCLFKKSYEISK